MRSITSGSMPMPVSRTLTVKTARGLSEEIVIRLFGGELDGILEQVPNDLLKFRGVGSHMVSLRAQIEMHAVFWNSPRYDKSRRRSTPLVRIDWSERNRTLSLAIA